MGTEKDFQRRAVMSKTPSETSEHQVRFEPGRFNKLVFDKGYDVWIDRAFRCPCVGKTTGQPLMSCNNCLGVGWIYTNRSETRVAIQGIKAKVEFAETTKINGGMANITARATDRLAFMDRIILQDVEGYYNEIVRTRLKDGKRIFYTEYPIVDIEEIFGFDTDKTPLTKLTAQDYTITDNYKVTLSDTFKPGINEITLTMRYRHLMTYHVVEMNRDIMKVRQKGCVTPEEQLAEMPINGLIRKAHYLYDNDKYEQEGRLIRN